MSGQQRNESTLAQIIGRFICGLPLDGVRRTTCGPFTRAAGPGSILTPHGRASAWSKKAHAERAAWRMGILAIACASGYGYLAARALTLGCLIASAVVISGLAAWRASMVIRDWPLNHQVVRPLFRTMAPLSGYSPMDRPREYLTIPRDYATNEKAQVRFKLSPFHEYNVAQQKAITALMSRRLGGDWCAEWQHDKIPAFLIMRHEPQPPRMVTYKEFRAVMDAEPESVLTLGYGTGLKIISLDMDSESPHLILSMGTGAGKTSTIGVIIARAVKLGIERIDVIDTKDKGYEWCEDLPGVYVHRGMDAQMRAIHDVRERMHARYGQRGTEFKRNLLIVEEQNTWADLATDYWQELRENMEPAERRKAPKKNPAIRDLFYILFMGRQARINVISIFQRASVKAMGSGDARDQYGAKLLSRFSVQAWKSLVGISPVPRSSQIPGRAIFVMGEDIHKVQLAYLTEDECREYALSAGAQPVNGGSPASAEVYSLREIASKKIVPIRYGALIKQRKRHPDAFPEPAKRGTGRMMLYTAESMRAWYDKIAQ